jgi:hypothetical protein
MATWNFDPNMYEEQDFAIIPVGDHRVRIADVAERVSKNGNDMFELTLEVSGYNSRLWHYLVLDKSDAKKTNQRIGDFFNSFGINDHNLGSGKQWIGKVGAVKVKHEEYNGNNQAKVAFLINRKNQDKLPPAKFSGAAAPAAGFQATAVPESDLPF